MITKLSTADHLYGGYDMYGLSTDEKPTDVANASTFYEMDTATLYMYDEQNKVWLPQ